MAERLKAHAWKACIRATVSRVRIPLPPPLTTNELYESIVMIVATNPNLLEIPCGTVEQMKLVNTFCWLYEYAESGTKSE